MSWGFYDAVLREVGNRPIRVTYDRGRIEIMSPLPKREKASQLLSSMVFVLAEEKDIPISSYGSTTFRRRGADRGLEPDKCFYVQNVDRVDQTETLVLDVVPPPDLAIEIDVTHRAIDRLPIYATLGVPELWRHDGAALAALSLGNDGQYHPVEFSVAFPFLPVGELNRFLAMWPGANDSRIMKAFRAWVRTIR